MDTTTYDGETFARRRDRRVSFAETTAVHVFDRDDSSGSPPKDDSHVTLSPCSDSGDNSSRDTREDEDGDDEDEELAVPPVRFIRDMTDSSPGSASAASVASNDDDNFFGPVSRSFMNSGGLSDSGVSEDNNNVTHDITLDSTAFSLHFRNIGGDDRSANSASSLLTTPTDNKTPCAISGTNELSGANDMVSRLNFSGIMSSAGLGDFSLVANKSSKYDYGSFSATLNDLLRQVDDSLKPVSLVSHPVDTTMVQKGERAKLLTGEASRSTDASMDQGGDCAKPLTGEDPYPVDVSTDKNGIGAKILTGEISRNVSIDKNSDGSKPIAGEKPQPIDVSIDKNGDSANPLPGEVPYPIDVSMDQNGGNVELLTFETFRPNDTPMDQNGDSAMLLIGEISHPSDIAMDHNGDGANLQPGEVSHPTDVSVDQNGDDAELLTEEASHPIDAPMDQNGNTATLLNRKVSRPIAASMDQNAAAAILLNKEVSHPIDALMVQNGDGAKFLNGEDPHPIDVSFVKNGNGTNLVRGEVSGIIDASIEKNVNSDEVLILSACASDDEPANEKDEAHSEDMHEDSWSNTIADSPKVNATSPQNTISLQVGSAITLPSPLTTVQHSECKPMRTPNMPLVNAQTSSNSKLAQLSETCQSPSMSSELFKHSERISAIKESVLREFPKEDITSTCLAFENENLPPSQPPDEIVVCNQEFDLEGRKRKLQQLLGSVEDRPAKHAKSLTHENQEHGEKLHNSSHDWRKLVENMSDITKISFSPCVQKLSIEELCSWSGVMEKLHMARKYERLSDFLRNCDSTDEQQRRLEETKSLHDKLIYEKAKLELNRLKLNKLHSKVELVRQRAEECLNLKSTISDLCCSSSKKAYTFPTTSISVTQGGQDRLITKRQALKEIKQNIINLSASLRVSCKITEEISSDDIITIAKEHLRLRNTHSIVKQDIKLWKLHDIANEDKWREIALDYNFLTQRFRLGTGISVSTTVNTTINKTKILQAFRNMNACSAIEFVFGAKCAARNVDSLKLIRQETSEMSLLLGNAVVVLHEVRAAKRELLNLISTNFNCKPSNTKMLELQLSFWNFKRGKKVVLSLDLSDLKFGMYPSEPSALHVGIDQTTTTFNEAFIKEITALVQRLPAGRLMVLRLCRAVSQYVNSSCM